MFTFLKTFPGVVTATTDGDASERVRFFCFKDICKKCCETKKEVMSPDCMGYVFNICAIIIKRV
ncbi:MAG: hypothetical protein A2W17_08855 [Planctomycetes bacterium RBG_16_41_13]|nr:MAG: hypothetical protein A2W17_08855 [Planctomycetes bacterium RBG_16_41_13]